MASDGDLMMQTLELAAERCEDLTPLVYERFSTLAPDAALLAEMDELARGRMLNEAIYLLLDQANERTYVKTVAASLQSDHETYGDIAPVHYQLFYEALVATLRTLLADAWSEAHEAAWHRQIARLTGLFQPS